MNNYPNENFERGASDPLDAHLLQQINQNLWSDMSEVKAFYDVKPLLAHYTSISTLEAILKNKEFWFSNPLIMNDLEELRFGINKGRDALMNNPELEAACKTQNRLALLRHEFDNCLIEYYQDHVLNTYVFCLSEHDKENDDGLLSMWRGYGANGNGAAIVIDAGKITRQENTPLILARVCYDSPEKRRKWISEKITALAKQILEKNIPDNKLHIAARAFFERLKLFALFTKHSGFSEEHEWRAVYLPERDPSKSLGHLIDYALGPRGIESKLKFKIAPLAGLIDDDISLYKIIHRIILGPTISSPLQRAAVARMLDRYAPELSNRLVVSTIPFRA